MVWCLVVELVRSVQWAPEWLSVPPLCHPQAVWWNLSGVGEIATKKVKQRPKPSVVSPPGTKWGQRVGFDQRDQAQRPTIIRRQVAENMTEGFHRPVAVKDIWQQFNHKE